MFKRYLDMIHEKIGEGDVSKLSVTKEQLSI